MSFLRASSHHRRLEPGESDQRSALVYDWIAERLQLGEPARQGGASPTCGRSRSAAAATASPTTRRVPVAWGSKTNLPTSFTFTLPRDVSFEGLEAFAATYTAAHLCRFRSARRGRGEHVVLLSAQRSRLRPGRGRHHADHCVGGGLSLNTTGKFLEYNKVWEDGELRVIAIFGKLRRRRDDGDAGISAYNEFLRASRSRLLSAGSCVRDGSRQRAVLPGTEHADRRAAQPAG